MPPNGRTNMPKPSDVKRGSFFTHPHSLSRLNLRNGNALHHPHQRRSDRTEDSTEDGFGGSSWFGGRYSASPTPSPAFLENHSLSHAADQENDMMPIQVSGSWENQDTRIHGDHNARQYYRLFPFIQNVDPERI